MAFAQSRPIAGAVATLGVSERVAFLRRTYAHLGAALIGWAGLTAFLLGVMTETSWKFSSFALKGQWTWLLVLVAFMAVGWLTDRLARSETSRGLQYAGLGLGVVAEAFILQPLLWVLFIKFGEPGSFQFDGQGNIVGLAASGKAMQLLGMAAGITVAIFAGLTATVFITKKDFSFLRGILVVGSFAALGVMVCAMIFGFQLGALFAGVMILLMAGYILYQTSLVMEHYPPTHHVSAALMLFSTVATLFWYVLQFVMQLANDR